MMKRLLIPMVLALAACDNPTPPPKTAEPVSDPLFAAQRQALQKAEAVQGQVDAAAEAQKKQIEQAAQQ
jgi:hypothetical protein